jgi:hypothetical protein
MREGSCFTGCGIATGFVTTGFSASLTGFTYGAGLLFDRRRELTHGTFRLLHSMQGDPTHSSFWELIRNTLTRDIPLVENKCRI